MPDRKITIKIGAAFDSDLKNVFVPFSTAARKAKDVVSKEIAGAAKATEDGGKKMSAAAKRADQEVEAAFAKLEAEVAGKGAKLATPATKSIQEFAKESKSVFAAAAANFKLFASEAESSMRKVEKATSAAELGLSNAKSGRGGRGGGAIRVGKGAAVSVGAGFASAVGLGRSGLGFAEGVAHSMGVDTDAGSLAEKNAALQTRMNDLSNSGFMAGANGTNGRRQDPRELTKDVQEAANEAAYSFDEAAQGLQEFVGKTGDLQLGRDVFKDLARLSRATGANLNDMVGAAGEVASSMGDVPNKAEKLQAIMRAVAGQGKLGAVEIKDMASRLGKLSASAPKFEGDFAKNMAIMGAIAQEARQNGASSAAQAATAVEGFTGTFTKGARAKAFGKAGIDIYSKTEPGKIASGDQLIIRALQKKGMDPKGFNALFADRTAQRAVSGYQKIYQQTYNATNTNAAGGPASDADRMAAATKAVSDEFDRMTQSAMGLGEVAESFDRAMGGAEAKVTLFNNSTQESVRKMQASIGPAVDLLAPKLLAAADATASFIVAMLGGKDENQASYESTDEKSEAELKQYGMRAAGGTLTDDDRTELERRGRVTGSASAAADQKVKDDEKDLFEHHGAMGSVQPETLEQDKQIASKLHDTMQKIHDTLGVVSLGGPAKTEVANVDALGQAIGAAVAKALPKGGRTVEQ